MKLSIKSMGPKLAALGTAALATTYTFAAGVSDVAAVGEFTDVKSGISSVGVGLAGVVVLIAGIAFIIGMIRRK